MNIVKLILFICFFYSSIQSQITTLKFDHITTKDGLSNNFCYCTFKDLDGYIWFGTEDGLNRWDGYDFKIFKNNPDDSSTISDNQILWITEDSEGVLWISTAFGLNRYIKDTESFKRYIFDDQGKSLPHANTIGTILEDSLDIFWIGTRVGLIKFNKKSGEYTRFIPEPENLDFSLIGTNYFIWMIRENKNALIIGTADRMFRFNIDTEKFEGLSQQHIYQKDQRMRPVADVIKPYIDNEGFVWVQTLEGGIHKYDLQSQKLTVFSKLHQLSGITFYDQVWSISNDKIGRVWLTTIGKGLFCVDLLKNISIQYLPDTNDKNSISSQWLTNIYLDSQGILWASTFDKGINRIKIAESKVTIFGKNPVLKKSPPAGEIMDICEDDGWLWISTIPGGAAKMNIETNEFFHFPYLSKSQKATLDRRISAILRDGSGTIWLGTYGLDKYNKKNNTFTHFVHNPSDTNSICNNFILSLYEDVNGIIWCGTRGAGIEHFNSKTNIFTHYRHIPDNPNSLCNDIVRIILQDEKGFLWLGTENGLSRLEILDDGTHKYTTFNYQQNNPNSLTNNFIYSVFEDSKKRLWIGTKSGLNLFIRETQSFISFDQIEQIHKSIIYSMVEDDHHNLWLRTNIGLIRFNPESKKYRLFNENDGLKDCRSIVYGYRGFTKGSNGKFYYGAPQSLMVFHPDSIEGIRQPPKVILTQLRVNYKLVETGAEKILVKALNYHEQLSLSHNQNFISITFGTLDYFEPEKIIYSYKMEGLNNEWISNGNNRTASYTGLAPGSYTFLVKASYDTENWTEPFKSLKILILPPWWATWWFRAIMLFCFAALIYFIYKYRVKRILEIERMRIQIASDLHDDVGSSLTKITVHSEIIKNTNDLIKINNSSAKIGNMSREIITSFSDIIWSIDARNDKVGDLIDRMRDYLDQVFPAGTISTDFQTHGLKFENSIDQTLRQNIYLIFKEAVNNAAKHSGASEMKIHMTNGSGKFRLEIIDNGKGIELNGKSKGYHGIENMKLRAERIGGELKIESDNNTKIILVVKEL